MPKDDKYSRGWSRTEREDWFIAVFRSSFLPFGENPCLEIFENTKQNTNLEAPALWLALMGMKHSSRCLLLRRKMAENGAESTES